MQLTLRNQLFVWRKNLEAWQGLLHQKAFLLEVGAPPCLTIAWWLITLLVCVCLATHDDVLYFRCAHSKLVCLLPVVAGCCSSAGQHSQAVLPALEGLGGP